MIREAYNPHDSCEKAASSVPKPPLLISGGNGTLGQAFARICYLRGLPYRLLTRSELDIADVPSIKAAIDAFQPWAIVNAAGFARINQAEQQEALCHRENTVGPALLARACAERSISLMTFSADQVFGGNKIDPYMESDPGAPLNIYGWSKLIADKRVSALCPQALIIRPGTLFGPWDDRNFLTQTLTKLRRNERVAALSDVHVSPTYIPDLVNASLDLLIDRESGIWHLASEGAVSWAEFASEAAQLAQLDQALVEGYPQEALGLTARRPRRTVLGSERGQLLPALRHAIPRYFEDHETAKRVVQKALTTQVMCEECATG